MIHFFNFLLLFSTLVLAEDSSTPADCCPKKTVGEHTYRLVKQEDTSAFDCVSECVYEREDKPGKMICFKQGDLPASCSAKSGGRRKDGLSALDQGLQWQFVMLKMLRGEVYTGQIVGIYHAD